MGFVVPASIGHTPYATPLLEYLVARFERLRVVAIRQKLFPRLSEDCWLLFATGFGGSTNSIDFAPIEHFGEYRKTCRPRQFPVQEWRRTWNRRLRPYLLNDAQRSTYQNTARRADSPRLGLAASVGIGYVSGDNDFFHLRPSEAARWEIPDQFLHPTVRNARVLPSQTLSHQTIEEWRQADDPMLLLRLPKSVKELPTSVAAYLSSEKGQRARESYKCRNRHPWYSVPDVRVPSFFLTYMSGKSPSLVKNAAAATCTNALHALHLRNGIDGDRLMHAWNSAFVELSCELEGHALGGGMLKLEPREASRVVIPSAKGASRSEGIRLARRRSHTSSLETLCLIPRTPIHPIHQTGSVRTLRTVRGPDTKPATHQTAARLRDVPPCARGGLPPGRTQSAATLARHGIRPTLHAHIRSTSIVNHRGDHPRRAEDQGC